MWGVHVVTKVFQKCGSLEGQIFIQLDLHRMCGITGTGKSSPSKPGAIELRLGRAPISRLGNRSVLVTGDSHCVRLSITFPGLPSFPIKTATAPHVPG